MQNGPHIVRNAMQSKNAEQRDIRLNIFNRDTQEVVNAKQVPPKLVVVKTSLAQKGAKLSAKIVLGRQNGHILAPCPRNPDVRTC